MDFEFSTSTHIIFGRNSVRKVPKLVNEKGNKVFIVTGRNTERAEYIEKILSKENIQKVHYSVEKEPTTGIISRGVHLAREAGCNLVLGFGGGSVIDSAKAIAALTPNDGDIMDYLEVIGKGQNLKQKPLPLIAIPTTAGTGAEVTKNAVIHSPENQVKVSLRSSMMYPDTAVVDPELTCSLPPDITASTGMDAFTHLLEAYVSKQSNPFIDMICREGISRVAISLIKAFKNGADIQARENMAFASLLGGIALSHVKLGAVHGFAGPLGGILPIPHGVICAALLPAVIEVNCREAVRTGEMEILKKYNEVAKIITGNTHARIEEGITWIYKTIHDIKIPKLTCFGLSEDYFPGLADKAENASSMKGNPFILNHNQRIEILKKTCFDKHEQTSFYAKKKQKPEE
ncbi:MAG: iron-containing alcohol dehydrogenase [Mariniphaga sp.]